MTPLIPPSQRLPELTLKVFIFSVLLAAILAAANAYLALKIGTTISASIPASILAMGIFRFFKKSNVLESNLVQTTASAGEGIAAAVSFVLPAMLILHIWQGFPYWETVIITLLGGLMGVLFSIPLRRIFLNMPRLKFPEGTAIGNILSTTNSKALEAKQLVQGVVVGGIISFLQTGFKVISDDLQLWMNAGKSLIGIGFGFNVANLAAGYIVGIGVATSFLFGLVLGWLVILPLLALHYGIPHGMSAYDASGQLWSEHLRFVGVGTMLVGGVWTLIRLLKPIVSGLQTTFRAFHRSTAANQILRTEFDLPVTYILWTLLFCGVATFYFLFLLMKGYHFSYSNSYLIFITMSTLCFILFIGFLISSICGYFAGLIGSTNNPLSGLLIAAILLLSLFYVILFNTNHITLPSHINKVASMVILVTMIVACIATVANENLQDLKAGQMVGATPWKQQIMLAIGVVVSAFILGPILELLFNAYGIANIFPHPGMDHSQMLAAPQASLMATLTKGVLTHQLNWDMIILGAIIALFILVFDEILQRWHMHLPPLAVGIAIYLPPEIITPLIIGGFVSYLVNRKKANTEKQHRASLLACGLVAGSSLMGVILAIPFVIAGSANALALVGEHFIPFAHMLGLIAILALCIWLYRKGT